MRRLVFAQLFFVCAFFSSAIAYCGAVNDVKTGCSAMTEGEYEKAEEYFTRAIDAGGLSNEAMSLALLARGNAYYAEGNLQAALSDFDRAISLRPNHPEAYYNRGNLHCMLRQFDSAIADYTKAIELAENDANAHNNRGMAWHEKGNFQSALANYNRAIAINPNEPLFYANRGRLWDSVGDDALARADYLQAKELDPSIRTPID